MADNMKYACADMILTDAIEDMAVAEGISKAEARDIILNSGAYADLYNLDSRLWTEGPDYFREYVRKIRKTEAAAPSFSERQEPRTMGNEHG